MCCCVHSPPPQRTAPLSHSAFTPNKHMQPPTLRGIRGQFSPWSAADWTAWVKVYLGLFLGFRPRVEWSISLLLNVLEIRKHVSVDWLGRDEEEEDEEEQKGGEREEGKENLGWVSLPYFFFVFLSGQWMGSEPGPGPIRNLHWKQSCSKNAIDMPLILLSNDNNNNRGSIPLLLLFSSLQSHSCLDPMRYWVFLFNGPLHRNKAKASRKGKDPCFLLSISLLRNAFSVIPGFRQDGTLDMHKGEKYKEENKAKRCA